MAKIKVDTTALEKKLGTMNGKINEIKKVLMISIKRCRR